MTTLVLRGSGTPATTGTTWATVTNAVDGTPGTNPATYATMTNATASAVATIEVTGYGFSSSIATTDTLNSVSVSVRHLENNTARFTSVTYQAFDGATAIGTAQTATLSATAVNATAAFAATLTQLRSSTFKVRVTITGAASTQSRVFSLDHIDVTADYTIVPPAITQAAYRFYADGTETGSTALAGQDTSYTADTSAGDVNLQVRARLQSTSAIAAGATDDWQLQYEKNASGTWGNVLSPSTAVDSYPSANFSVNNGMAGGASAVTAVGQSFLGNGRNLGRLGFYLAKIGVPTGTVTAVLYAHSGTFGSTGIPTGTALATSTTTINSVDLATTSAMFYFDFDGTFTLANGTAYFAVVSTTNNTASSSNAPLVGLGSTGHAGNRATFGASVWTDFTTNDVIFEAQSVAPTTVGGYDSANLTDGAATTNRLGAGSGSFVAGKVSEDGLVDDLGWTANNYTELLYSVTLKQSDLTPADTLRFRVLRNGVTTGLTYTQTPTITIGAGAPGPQTVNAQVANLALAGVAGTPTSAGGTTPLSVTAQVATLTLTGVTGTKTVGPVTVTAQVATLALTGVAGTKTVGAVTVTAQVATVALTAVAGAATVGPLTVTAQVATLTLTGVPGTKTGGPVTLTATVGLLALTGVPGSAFIGAPPAVRLKVGTANVSALRLGTTTVTKAFLDSVQVWPPTTAGTDVLLEPFNNYTFAPWALVNTPTIATGRTGNGASFVGASSPKLATYTILAAAESDTVTMGFAWKATSLALASTPMVELRSDAGATLHGQLSLRSSTGGQIQVNNGTGGSVGSALHGLTAGTFAYIEWQLKLSDTDGFTKVRINGVEVISVIGIDTKNAGTKTTLDSVRLVSTTSGVTTVYDDLYITTGAGAAFKGDIAIP